MHFIFDSAREMLRFLLEHKSAALPALTGGTLAFLTFLWTKLSLPNVRYMLRQDDRKTFADELNVTRHSRVTILVRNMDSIPIAGVLIVEATLKHPTLRFTRARHAAGPWAHAPEWLARHEDPTFTSTVLLRCGGLPPDGAVQFELEVNGMLPQEGPRQVLAISLHPKSTMKVRSFSRLPTFSLWSSFSYFFLRLLFGMLLYLFIVSQWLGYEANGEYQVAPIDTAIFLGGEVLVVAAWLAIMQFRGKDVVCGYEPSAWRDVQSVRTIVGETPSPMLPAGA